MVPWQIYESTLGGILDLWCGVVWCGVVGVVGVPVLWTMHQGITLSRPESWSIEGKGHLYQRIRRQRQLDNRYV